MYYVYFHIRLDTNTVFYIGKGKGRRSTSKRNRNDYWHNIVNSKGYTVKKVSQGLDEESAYNLESKMIQMFKGFGQAEANILLGGGKGLPNGYIPWNKGISPSPEVRAKIANTLKGNKPWNKGKTLSDDHVANLSKSHMGLEGNHKKRIIDTVLGTVYDSVEEAALSVGLKRKTLTAMLIGQNPNKTNLTYYN